MLSACLKSGFEISFFERGFFLNRELINNKSPIKVSIIENNGPYKSDFDVNLFTGDYFEVIINGKKTIGKFNNLISSDGIKFRVIKADSAESTEQNIFVKVANLNSLVIDLHSSLFISYPYPDSNRLLLSLKLTNIKKAVNLLTAIRSIYLKSNPDSTTLNSLRFINKKIDSLSADLKRYPAEIAAFKIKKQSNPVKVENKKPLDKTALKKQSDIYKLISSYLKIPDNQFSFVPNTFGLKDSRLELLVNKLNDNQIEKQKLLQDQSPSSTSILNKKIEILNLKAVIQKRLDSLNTNIKNQINGITVIKPYSENSNALKFTNAHNVIKAEQQGKVALYFYLIKKRESLEAVLHNTLILTKKENDVKIRFDKKPILSILVIAVFLGLLTPIPFKLLKKPTIKKLTVNDILNATKIPLLGSLGIYTRNRDVITPIEYDTVIGTQLIELRKKVEYIKNNKVIMITSLRPGDGKSFIARNLSVALSAQGKSVLLIQTGLIRVHDNLIDTTISNNLNSYLTDSKLSVNNIAYKTIYNNLSIIQSGQVDPVAQFATPRMQALIKQAKLIFDYIIIDTWTFGIEKLTDLKDKKPNLIINVISTSSASINDIAKFDNFYKNTKKHSYWPGAKSLK